MPRGSLLLRVRQYRVSAGNRTVVCRHLRSVVADSSIVMSQFFPLRSPKPVEGLLKRAVGLTGLEDLYTRLQAAYGENRFLEGLLKDLEIGTHVSDTDLGRVPRRGPGLLLLNHP